MSFLIKHACAGMAACSLLITGPSFASAERLEADLSALFADGELSLGEVSKASMRDRFTAEDIVYESLEGERLQIGRYIVVGNYDNPEEVRLEGVRVEDSLTELPLLSIESLVLGEPGAAVFTDETVRQTPLNLASLSIDGITLDLNADLASEIADELDVHHSPGRLEIAKVRGEDISEDALGMLEFTDVAMHSEDLGDLGKGAFILERMRIENLRGMQSEQDEHLGAMLLDNMVIESDALVASFDHFRVDGDFNDGEGGIWLEGFALDLNRMIALAPPDERTEMRMFSNILTDGSGKLALDAHFAGRWEEQAHHSVLGGDGRIALNEALGLSLDLNLPMMLPDDVSPMDALRDTRLLETATLLGGDIALTLDDKGLLERLVILGATLEGVPEAQVIEQARTQAQGFGMMFGPEIQSVLMGMVELIEGNASQLMLDIKLPAESNVQAYVEDPLGLPSQLSVQVETR